MALDSREILHTIVITDLKDEASKIRVAEALVRVTKGASFEQIQGRLQNLPWTLTRKATAKRAAQVIKLLERRGAMAVVIPPLPASPLPHITETQVLSETELLSETQIMSATQFIAVPTEPAETSPVPPKPFSEPPKGPTKEAEPTRSGGFQIEPLSLGGILDRTFQICRRHFWKLMAIIAIPWLVTFIVALAALGVIGVVAAGFTLQSLKELSGWAIVLLAVTVVPSAIVVVVTAFYLSQAALIHATSCVYLDREILVGEAYGFVLNRLGKYFLTSMLFVVVCGALVFFPIIIGAFLFYLSEIVLSSGWWSVITWPLLALVPTYGILKLLLFDKVVIIEDVGYAAALGRSWRLVTGKAQGDWPRGYFLRLVILLHLFLLISITISLFFSIPASLFPLLVPEWKIVGQILDQVFRNVGSLVGGMFGSVCLVVFYYDIRNRKEGFDLQVLARATER